MSLSPSANRFSMSAFGVRIRRSPYSSICNESPGASQSWSWSFFGRATCRLTPSLTIAAGRFAVRCIFIDSYFAAIGVSWTSRPFEGWRAGPSSRSMVSVKSRLVRSAIFRCGIAVAGSGALTARASGAEATIQTKQEWPSGSSALQKIENSTSARCQQIRFGPARHLR